MDSVPAGTTSNACTIGGQKADNETGSDSGVEVCCYSSSNAPTLRSCDLSASFPTASTVTSYRNACDVTSENGSESSSYTTSSNKSSSYRGSSAVSGGGCKKRVSIATPASSTSGASSLTRSMTVSSRSRSSARGEDKPQTITPPDFLPLRGSGISKLRTPTSTPTSPGDGRWPSISMKTPINNRMNGDRNAAGGTLPRSRRRTTTEQSANSNIRSVSASREPQQGTTGSRKTSQAMTQSTHGIRRTTSYRARDRTENSIQTAPVTKDMTKHETVLEKKLAITSLLSKSVQVESNYLSNGTLQLVVDERNKLQEQLKACRMELDELKNTCRKLQQEKENAALEQNQKLFDISLQQRALEEESSEMYDFLQAERGSMIHEMEVQKTNLTDLKAELKYKTEIAERQQKECRHLVRVSEQRRYENLALQSRLLQSRELLLQQGAMTSRAAVALVGLSNRLDTLVESLAESYEVSGNDLEELVFYNEAYTQSSGDDDNQSVKENVQSSKNLQQNRKTFLSAITCAIRNSRDKRKSMKEDPDPNDFLDSEMEPELMMDNVLEDVMMPNNHSHNMISSSENTESRNSGIMDEDLHNLSLAILDHQRSENEDSSIMDSFPDRPSMNDCFADLTLVDRVINIDNSVTKLLKILRIVQMQNDSYLNEVQDRSVSVSS